MKEIKKEYSNGEITVVWQPAKCIHAGECVKNLPEVYDPKAKPWINVNKASTDELKKQLSTCPSGALSYYVNEGERAALNAQTKVDVAKDGPLLVHGAIKIVDSEGKESISQNVTAFCRCGASTNKPYCDGSHNKVGFKG